MWRFNIDDPNPTSWTGRIIFKSNPGCNLDTTTGRKIFYPPDVTLEKGNYEILSFGTGDREHPEETDVINRFYMVKDKSSIETMPVLTECNLYDVTEDEYQAEGTTSTRKGEILAALDVAYGWLIKLNLYSGEKSLAAPVVFYKVAYFTTFNPTASGDPCQAGFGTARLYAVDYLNGNAVFNFYLPNDTFDAEGNRIAVLRRPDRSLGIGTSIPSGVIITFIGGEAVAYIGVGGGVFAPQLSSTKSIIPTTWKIVF
jgi:type IV pilus assembly protein PilY1